MSTMWRGIVLNVEMGVLETVSHLNKVNAMFDANIKEIFKRAKGV